MLRGMCALNDLVKVTSGEITYCDNSDSATVPHSHWCDVTNVTGQTESGHNTRLTYQCDGGVWRREFGTSTEIFTGIFFLIPTQK
ncbi:hypothetical protein DPMN_095123 [Dreissena polymorpha]|uniref:Uncharacterized protein n=1 Tax=Dreissena polymorpha TaxID=45954 RepID=A0A9D4L700_DREPO|nr:hypothetical protein DPMN_095123 [Dreissena polymorpha]